METKSEQNISVGEIVAADFRTASVFTGASIDFCCGGRKTLEQACTELGIDLKEIEAKLNDIKTSEDGAVLNFNAWGLPLLIDYILNIHHSFVLKSLPELLFYTNKIASVHGERHPELIETAVLFRQINDELLQHLKNEEEVLFPAIKSYLQNKVEGTASIINSEIVRMLTEHEFAGGAMDRINMITGHYKVPDDGCSTYKAAFSLLRKFEDDLHVHVHLENNILFPKALELK